MLLVLRPCSACLTQSSRYLARFNPLRIRFLQKTFMNLQSSGAPFVSDDSENDAKNGEGVLTIPAEVFYFVLPYMNLQNILKMEGVCKYLKDCIRNDAYLWRTLYISPPLSSKIRDSTLMELFERAKGQLECLSLVDCLMISEDVIKHIVFSSPRLYKLFLPGCSRVTADGVVDMLRERKERGMVGLRGLKLHRINGLTREHLEVLLSMMGSPQVELFEEHKTPQFYHRAYEEAFSYDGRVIDVELCPRCGNVRLVYDCTRQRCQEKQDCRGCEFCVARCVECGVCIDGEDEEVQATICQHHVCLKCWLILIKCAECNRAVCWKHTNKLVQIPTRGLICGECSDDFSDGLEFDL